MFAAFLLCKGRVFFYYFCFFFFFYVFFDFFLASIHQAGTPFEPPPHQSKVLEKEGGRGRNNPSSEGFSSPGHLHYFFSGNGPRGRKRHVSRISIAASLMKGMSL